MKNFYELSTSLINEIQEMRQGLKSGKLSMENYAAQLAGISQIEKQQNILIKVRVIQERFKKPFSEVGDLKLIDDPENQFVDCPGAAVAIKRSECLDYSGDNKFDECICEAGKETQNLLLGKK